MITGIFAMAKRQFLVGLVLSLPATLLSISPAYPICSPFVGDMVINEAYGEGPYSSPFVETKLLNMDMADVLSSWYIQTCHHQGKKEVCETFAFSESDLTDLSDSGNPYFMFYPGNQMMDLHGMDITIRDADDRIIDYLSVNGYDDQQGACSAVDGNSVEIGPGIKGAERLPDGTGDWYAYGERGAQSSPTPDASNEGETLQIDHYRIYHPADALTCQAASVTVRACLDTGCVESYQSLATVNLFSDSDWIEGGGQIAFTGESAPLHLRKNSPGTVSLGIASADPGAEHPVQCFSSGAVSDCQIVFHDSGFIFNVSPLTSCQESSGITIQAVRKDDSTQACVGDGSFASQTGKVVDFALSYENPSTPLTRLFLNGTALPFSGTAQVALDFDQNAVSTLLVSYADAGKLRLSASFAGSGEEAGLSMTGTSSSFVVVPHHLRVRAMTDGSVVLDNLNSGGTPHWPAGEDFTVEVTGVCSDDSVTPNYAAFTELSAAAPYQPAGGALGALTAGALTEVNFREGKATGLAAYGEVGTMTLQVETTDYLGSGIDVSGSTAVGRFTPFRFDVSLNSPEFAPACDSGGFTYLGQSFVYNTDPVITVTARDKNGNTTENYTGDWWKITRVSLTGKTYSAASGTLDLSNIPAADPLISDLGAGMGTLAFDAGGGLYFTRNAVPDAPFDAEISLSIDVLDEDGIAAPANPVTFGAASAGNGIPFAGNGKKMLWGRLALQNAYGSEQVALPMPFRAEYFNGSAFVTNALDGCTGVAANLLTLTNDNGSVTADDPIPVGDGSGNSTASLSNPFMAGNAGLQFSAPRLEGYIDVQADLSSLPWLLYDWNGDGVQEGPSARATFGIYKSRPSLIYRRETYR